MEMMDELHDGRRLPMDEKQDDFSPISSYEPHIQARLTKFRLAEAKKRLLSWDKPDESELTWIIETCDSVITIALAHVIECERLWKPVNGTGYQQPEETDEITDVPTK
jgi:hypothetical protein